MRRVSAASAKTADHESVNPSTGQVRARVEANLVLIDIHDLVRHVACVAASRDEQGLAKAGSEFLARLVDAFRGRAFPNIFPIELPATMVRAVEELEMFLAALRDLGWDIERRDGKPLCDLRGEPDE